MIINHRCNDLPVEFVRVDVAKGQHRQPEYLANFPLGKVPALKVRVHIRPHTSAPNRSQDGDFCLWESVAIMRYLLAKLPCRPHWYPEEPRTRARVDAVLCWHFNNTREGSMKLCWNRCAYKYRCICHNKAPSRRAIAPVRGLPVNSAVADAAETLLRGALKDLERVWLGKGRWLCGASQPTIADLLIVCELEQLRLLDGATKVPLLWELTTSSNMFFLQNRDPQWLPCWPPIQPSSPGWLPCGRQPTLRTTRCMGFCTRHSSGLRNSVRGCRLALMIRVESSCIVFLCDEVLQQGSTDGSSSPCETV